MNAFMLLSAIAVIGRWPAGLHQMPGPPAMAAADTDQQHADAGGHRRPIERRTNLPAIVVGRRAHERLAGAVEDGDCGPARG